MVAEEPSGGRDIFPFHNRHSEGERLKQGLRRLAKG